MSNSKEDLLSHDDTQVEGIHCQKKLSNEDRYRLKHIFRLLGTRIIPCYFFAQNPQEFYKWQFNACRQTALITAYFFKKFLESFPHSEVKVCLWDGEFSDEQTPWYNHAWVTAHPVGAKKQVFIDVARVSVPTIVNFSTELDLPEAVSQDLRFVGTKTLKVVEMDYDIMMAQEEFYTGKKGYQICQDIENLMNIYGYDLANFKWKNPTV